MSSKDDNKPTGPCAACKKEEAIKRCTGCLKCGIETFYCNRECQENNWKRHKPVCGTTYNLSIKEANKATRRVQKSTNCQNCFKNNIEIGLMNACSRSRRDQTAASKANLDLYLEFNYNLQSFVPAERPKVVPISDAKEMYSIVASSVDRLYEMHKGKKLYLFESEESYCQFVLVTCKHSQRNYVLACPIAYAESQLESKKDLDLREVNYFCREVKLKSHLFQGWDAIRASNLQQQKDYLKCSQAYFRFAQNALQLLCNKPRHLTHGIVIHVRMGKEIGQIAELVTYGVKHIAEEIMVNMKMRVRSKKKQKQFIQNELDVRNSPKLLMARQQNPNNIMMVICFVDMETETTYIVDSEICELPMVLKGKKVKACNRDAKKYRNAKKYFKELQGMVKEMPSDLVEKVSL